MKIGSAPEVSTIPIKKILPICNGCCSLWCGACVAACPNGAAMLFTSAKVSQYAMLPQGSTRESRANDMVYINDKLGFGNCRMNMSARGLP